LPRPPFLLGKITSRCCFTFNIIWSYYFHFKVLFLGNKGTSGRHTHGRAGEGCCEEIPIMAPA